MKNEGNTDGNNLNEHSFDYIVLMFFNHLKRSRSTYYLIQLFLRRFISYLNF